MSPRHSMSEFSHGTHIQYVCLPRIAFQAELTFFDMYDKRILMKDRFGRVWSVFMSNAKELIPELTKGTVNAWWTMTKKGAAYGIEIDAKKAVSPSLTVDQDVPLLLEQAQDLNDLIPIFAKIL